MQLMNSNAALALRQGISPITVNNMRHNIFFWPWHPLVQHIRKSLVGMMLSPRCFTKSLQAVLLAYFATAATRSNTYLYNQLQSRKSAHDGNTTAHGCVGMQA